VRDRVGLSVGSNDSCRPAWTGDDEFAHEIDEIVELLEVDTDRVGPSRRLACTPGTVVAGLIGDGPDGAVAGFGAGRRPTC